VLRDGTILRNHEDVFIRKDGTLFDVVYSSAPIRSGGAIVGLVVVFRDVSAQKRMEAELFKNSKLESLGILAGGIAHDFNNILMAIIGNLALVKMTLGPQHEVLTRLTAAEKAVLRAQSLTQQLLTFSKGGQPVKKVVSIGQLVRESAGFALQGSNIRCDLSIPDDAWMVEVDDGQISQVIHNLVLNAQQAMPRGGTLLVKVANRVVGPEDGMPLAPGSYVSILVRDYGTGISPEHLSKIFDPFFTTKPRGSGLGLTTAYSIVKRHSGALLVDSKLGAGTTISVYLPRTESPAASDPSVTAEAPGAGRILFMDDDALILESAAALLTQLSYEVECARDGEEALVLFDRARRAGQPFDAVVLDLTVRGGMGGLETIKRLRDLDPQVKGIVSSGYSNDPVLADYAAYGFLGMVAKPYTVENLNRILREMTGPT
jgi:signal transduction histidine kinase/ActR/RegA family two-component response regulator